MFKKIKNIAASILVGLSLVAPMAILVPASVSATTAVTQGLCDGITAAEDPNGASAGTDCTTDTTAATNVNRLIKNIINLFSLIVGVISVIMIIVGGLKYITSGGDSGNITGAKNTILYALIGLVIVALAQVIVRFVLNKATA